MERTGDRENQVERTASVKAQWRLTLCVGEGRLTGLDVVQERVKSGEDESRQANVPSCMSTDKCPGQTNEAGTLLEGRSQAWGRKQ